MAGLVPAIHFLTRRRGGRGVDCTSAPPRLRVQFSFGGCLSAAMASMMKQLIVTADDFGAAREVNDAVEQAHRGGILTAASLMVSAPDRKSVV